ncbi:ABC transporter permease [Brevibacterium otitidis]|nr:hypothetical protein GCM10023233_21760 [Brevibacterium otitidis]
MKRHRLQMRSLVAPGIVREATQAVNRRRRNSIFTSLGVAFGILALVATVAVSSTVAAQVSSRFTALMATFVHVTDVPADEAGLVGRERLDRVRELNGVTAAGMLRRSTQPARVSTGGAGVEEATVIGAEPAALRAWRLSTTFGQMYDDGHEERASQVVLIGAELASRMGVSSWTEPTQLTLDGRVFTAIGVFRSPDPAAGLDSAIVVPMAAMTHTAWSVEAVELAIAVEPGAAGQVASEAPLAVDPSGTSAVIAQAPPDPQTLRQQVSSDTQLMVAVLAVMSLLIGALGISNTMLVSVVSRRHEIGVRAALGAQTAEILAQILWEGTIIGLIGGVIGTVIGLDCALAIALVNGWAAAIPLWLVPAGIALGGVVGAVASMHPALRAAQVDPVEALMS